MVYEREAAIEARKAAAVSRLRKGYKQEAQHREALQVKVSDLLACGLVWRREALQVKVGGLHGVAGSCAWSCECRRKCVCARWRHSLGRDCYFVCAVLSHSSL
jgi:hypothetical protein